MLVAARCYENRITAELGTYDLSARQTEMADTPVAAHERLERPNLNLPRAGRNTLP